MIATCISSNINMTLNLHYSKPRIIRNVIFLLDTMRLNNTLDVIPDTSEYCGVLKSSVFYANKLGNL